MKKIIPTFAIGALVLSFGSTAYAQTSNTQVTTSSNTEVSAGITPDSFFYFLDTWGEKISQLLAFTPEQKVKLNLELAKERLAEYNEMKEKKNVNKEILVETKERAQEEINTALTALKEEHGDDHENLDKDAQNVHEEVMTMDDDSDDADTNTDANDNDQGTAEHETDHEDDAKATTTKENETRVHVKTEERNENSSNGSELKVKVEGGIESND